MSSDKLVRKFKDTSNGETLDGGSNPSRLSDWPGMDSSGPVKTVKDTRNGETLVGGVNPSRLSDWPGINSNELRKEKGMNSTTSVYHMSKLGSIFNCILGMFASKDKFADGRQGLASSSIVTQVNAGEPNTLSPVQPVLSTVLSSSFVHDTSCVRSDLWRNGLLTGTAPSWRAHASNTLAQKVDSSPDGIQPSQETCHTAETEPGTSTGELRADKRPGMISQSGGSHIIAAKMIIHSTLALLLSVFSWCCFGIKLIVYYLLCYFYLYFGCQAVKCTAPVTI